MCFFVLSRSDTETLCSLTSTVIRCTRWRSGGCSRKSRREHVRPLLKALHWLPVEDKIIFKIATFVFRFFVGFLFLFFWRTLPPCLSSSLSVCTPRTFRSSSNGEKRWEKTKQNKTNKQTKTKQKTLSCKRWKFKGFGYRSFFVQAPLVLPAHIRHYSFLSEFKASLKTFLFNSAYSELL